MQTVTIKELFRNTPQAPTEARVNGWIRTLRDGKDFAFIELNDGTHFRNLQVVADANALADYKDIVKLPEGSSVTCEGTLVPTPEAKQPFELKASAITLVGRADADYPLQKKRHSFEYLRTIAHLRPRANTFSAAFRIRSLASFAIHKFFNERGFVYVHTPLITGSDCEGAGEMFRVTTLDLGKLPLTPDGRVDATKDFFGKQTNLTVSGQLNVEPFCMAFKDVYTFGPTFRAENSNTQRHAAEFWMIEPEIAFADLDDVMNLAEAMTRSVIGYVLEHAPDEMAFLNAHIDKELIGRLENARDAGFKRVTYDEAVDILRQSGEAFEFEPVWGDDLKTEHERYLTERHFGAPVFVTHYPKGIKSFYMRLDDGERTVAASDLLVAGVGELIGGSQREERLDVLLRRIDELGLNREDYEWYLDTRRYGTVPHGGYGIGFERLIMFLTGLTNIRDVLPYPRTPNNALF